MMIITERKKEMHKHRFAALVMAASISLTALSGCGAKTNNTTATSGEQEITFWYSNSGSGKDAINQLVSEFNAANKGKIKVKASYQGSYADVQQKFSAAVQSKSTPAILQMSDISTGFMLDSKITTPIYKLDEKGSDSAESDIPKVIRKYYSDDKGLLSMPMAVSEPVMYINRQLAEQSGLDVANPPKTFDEVVQWAKTIHDKTGAYGYSMIMTDSWILEQLSANAGIDICTPGNGRSGKPVNGIMMSNARQVKAFEQIADMFRSGVGLNPGNGSSAISSAFTSNQLGLALASSGGYTTMQPGSSPDNVVVARFPKLDDSKAAGTPIGGNSLWVVSAEHSEAEQKAAYEFAKFMLTPHAQAVFSKATGYLFANGKAAQEKEGREELADPNVKVFYDQLNANPASSASLGCRTGAFPSIRKDVIAAFNEALNGKDMKTAMKDGEAKAAQDIATYNKAVTR